MGILGINSDWVDRRVSILVWTSIWTGQRSRFSLLRFCTTFRSFAFNFEHLIRGEDSYISVCLTVFWTSSHPVGICLPPGRRADSSPFLNILIFPVLTSRPARWTRWTRPTGQPTRKTKWTRGMRPHRWVSSIWSPCPRCRRPLWESLSMITLRPQKGIDKVFSFEEIWILSGTIIRLLRTR